MSSWFKTSQVSSRPSEGSSSCDDFVNGLLFEYIIAAANSISHLTFMKSDCRQSSYFSWFILGCNTLLKTSNKSFCWHKLNPFPPIIQYDSCAYKPPYNTPSVSSCVVDSAAGCFPALQWLQWWPETSSHTQTSSITLQPTGVWWNSVGLPVTTCKGGECCWEGWERCWCEWSFPLRWDGLEAAAQHCCQ